MTPSTHTLTTKLNRPPVRPSLVPRPRLTARLDAGLARTLTLVSAPAGTGKTTLVADWLSSDHARPSDPLRRQPFSAAWLSLDEDDNDPVRFLAGLAAALGTAGPVPGTTLSLLHGPRPHFTSPKTLLTTLLNEFEAGPRVAGAGPVVLVLDDYHLISATTVHEAVAYMLERRPSALHVVITSRTEPPIPLARLRANDQLTELRAEDLHFTPSEAADFLNEAMGLKLSPEQVVVLAQRTEGWIAALQLAALALPAGAPASTPARRAEFVAGFGGSHRYVLDYLVEEVLSRQTEATQDFLLQTAILDRLHGPLCDAVTGQADGTASLAALERANLFLVPLDGERQWYRYHHLFAEALRTQLHRTQPGCLPDLHRRASRWYEQQGLPAEAIHHALAAADYDRAADLIEPAADRLIRLGQLETIRHWVQAVPEALVRARPGLCLWLAWTLIPLGQVEAAAEYACLAEASLSEKRQTLLAESNAKTAEQLTALDFALGQCLLVRCSAAQHRGEPEAAAALAREALAVLPRTGYSLRGLAYLDLGQIYQRQGNLAAAEDALNQALDEVKSAYHPYIHLQILCKLAELGLLRMRLRTVAELCQEAAAVAAEHRLEPLAAEAWLYLGEVSREWNRLDEAEHHLARGVALGESTGDQRTVRLAYTVWTRVKQARGDWAAAADLLPRGSRKPAWQAALWLAQGNLAAARQVFDRRGRHANGHRWDEFDDIVRARVRLAQGRGEAALALLNRWRGPLEAAGRDDLAVELALLQALAYQALEQWPQALRALDRALLVAERAGCVRLFLDEGQPMAALLARHAATQPPRPYVQSLLAAFSDSSGDHNPPPATRPPPAAVGTLPEPLRVREADILRLLAAGYSNPEIAERLSLSVNTVRWYIKQVYRKLDVHNRTQAALRARELNL